MYTPIDSSPGQLNKNFLQTLGFIDQFTHATSKNKLQGKTTWKLSVYIKNSIIFLLQSSNMEEIEHKDVYI